MQRELFLLLNSLLQAPQWILLFLPVWGRPEIRFLPPFFSVFIELSHFKTDLMHLLVNLSESVTEVMELPMETILSHCYCEKNECGSTGKELNIKLSSHNEKSGHFKTPHAKLQTNLLSLRTIMLFGRAWEASIKCPELVQESPPPSSRHQQAIMVWGDATYPSRIFL